MSENIYEEAWQKYYRENGLEWLASSHIYDIKQAFFAGIGASHLVELVAAFGN